MSSDFEASDIDVHMKPDHSFTPQTVSACAHRYVQQQKAGDFLLPLSPVVPESLTTDLPPRWGRVKAITDIYSCRRDGLDRGLGSSHHVLTFPGADAAQRGWIHR